MVVYTQASFVLCLLLSPEEAQNRLEAVSRCCTMNACGYESFARDRPDHHRAQRRRWLRAYVAYQSILRAELGLARVRAVRSLAHRAFARMSFLSNSLAPKTGDQNNARWRTQVVANAAMELARAASEAAIEAGRCYQREQDITDRLEYVQTAFWYCVHHKLDQHVIDIFATALGIPSEHYKDAAWASLEIDKRGIKDLPLPLESSNA